ncbi:hypothetical protein B484DRAFT_428984 [Ochromonadaceae sp. CCMP2298]|nr:hypothetical protein B484DRAFT_428984 [Ochromonadaceae sp. CCMP2298]
MPPTVGDSRAADLQRAKQESYPQRIQNLHESIFDDIERVFRADKKDGRKQLNAFIKNYFNDKDYSSKLFDVNYLSTTHEDATLLSICSRARQNDCMRMLVKNYNADINLVVEDNVSPLMLCAIDDNLTGVDFCMQKGANPWMRRRLRMDKSKEALTAEQWAFQNSSLSFRIVRYLHAVRGRVRGLELTQDDDSDAEQASTYRYLPCFCKQDIIDDLAECSEKDCLQWCHVGCCGRSKPSKSVRWYCPQHTASNHGFQASKLARQFDCVCGSGSKKGEVVQCSSDSCPVGAFHIECVKQAMKPEVPTVVRRWLDLRCLYAGA